MPQRRSPFDLRDVSDEHWAELKRLHRLVSPYWWELHAHLIDDVTGPDDAAAKIAMLRQRLLERYPGHGHHELVMEGLSVKCADCDTVLEVRVRVEVDPNE